VERREPDALDEAPPTHEQDTARFLVCVESVRKRLLDEDRICEVAVIDCCRYAGLIPGDSPDQTHIQTTQRKARKGEAEHTVVTIYEL
jgi:hypothetical protein